MATVDNPINQPSDALGESPIAGQSLQLGYEDTPGVPLATQALYGNPSVTSITLLKGGGNTQVGLALSQQLTGTTMPPTARKRTPGKQINTYLSRRILMFGHTLGGR